MRVRLASLLVVGCLLGSGACGSSHVVVQPTSTSPASLTPPTQAHPVSTPRPAPPAGLVDVDPSIVVRLAYATAHNFTGAPLPGYEANRGLLRPVAAAALLRADRRLRSSGLEIVVLDAYRPVRATRAMVAWAHSVHRDDLIGPYIAARSEHNLGTAVDVIVATTTDARQIDMGTPFDTLDARSHYANASGAALVNRGHLREVMIGAGFVPYDAEWWHFSVHVAGATPLDVVIR